MIIPRMISTVLRIGMCMRLPGLFTTFHSPRPSPAHMRRHRPRHRMPHPRSRHKDLQQRRTLLHRPPHRRLRHPNLHHRDRSHQRGPRTHLDRPYHRLNHPLGHGSLLRARVAARLCSDAHALAGRWLV